MNSTPLLPQHQPLIDASAISPQVAAQRGYQSLTTKAAVRGYGFRLVKPTYKDSSSLSGMRSVNWRPISIAPISRVSRTGG